MALTAGLGSPRGRKWRALGAEILLITPSSDGAVEACGSSPAATGSTWILTITEKAIQFSR